MNTFSPFFKLIIAIAKYLHKSASSAPGYSSKTNLICNTKYWLRKRSLFSANPILYLYLLLNWEQGWKDWIFYTLGGGAVNFKYNTFCMNNVWCISKGASQNNYNTKNSYEYLSLFQLPMVYKYLPINVLVTNNSIIWFVEHCYV